MEIKDAIANAFKEMVAQELNKIKDDINNLKEIVEVTNKRFGDINLKLVDHSRRIDEENKKINGVREELIQGLDDVKEKIYMPENVKDVVYKANKIDKNKKGYWEAYYQNGIVMVYIPPGEFIMGQKEEERKRLIDKESTMYPGLGGFGYELLTPLNKVYLDGYWIGKIQVTGKQYMQFVNETKSHYPVWLEKSSWYHIETGDNDLYRRLGAALTSDNYPIVGISWGDAAAYCDWLSQKINLPFKLPTEAQWEKAARGTNHRKYPWGNREPDRNLANFNSIIDRYTPVGSYPEGASPYGVLDMAGNVWDWCWDWYNPKYYKKSPPKNPTGPKKASNYGRVLRGGGCNDPAIFLCCSTHISYGIDTRRVDVGFRLSQDIK